MPYEIQKNIGKGSYGEVYKVVHTETSAVYAMKKVHLNTLTHYEKVNLITELRILATHKCPFIVKFKTAYTDKCDMFFITEYASNGDLSAILKTTKLKGAYLAEQTIWTYFLQVCVALSYLHNLNIIHRDLKPANIFIDANDNVKLGDFGVAKIMRVFMMYGQTQIGTPLYMSPEIYKRERYDAKVDIWALGCVLYEMMTLRPAFAAASIHELKHNVFRGNVQAIREQYSGELKALLKKLLCVHPRQRPSIRSIISTDFIEKQLKLRKLQFFDTDDIAPAFHVNCVVPRTIDRWKSVVDMFVSLNATVMLSAREDEKIKQVNIAKNHIKDDVTQNASELASVNTKIHALEGKILEAQNYIQQCEAILAPLRKRKVTLEQSVIHANFAKPTPKQILRPIPPIGQPPPHRTPKIFKHR